MWIPQMLKIKSFTLRIFAKESIDRCNNSFHGTNFCRLRLKIKTTVTIFGLANTENLWGIIFVNDQKSLKVSNALYFDWCLVHENVSTSTK